MFITNIEEKIKNKNNDIKNYNLKNLDQELEEIL